MNITVKVDTSKLDRLMAGVPAALARAQQKALVDVGGEVKSEAAQTFRNPSMRPAPWAPRKPTYIVKVNKRTKKKTRKLDDHPLLQKSGVMKRDLNSKIVSSDTVVIGTPHEYIKYHQFGTKHMPARPVFPIDQNGNLTPRCLRKITQNINDAFVKELRKLGFQ